MKNRDMPAMPITSNTESMDGAFLVGLTKREYFAGLALQALLSRGAGVTEDTADRARIAAERLLQNLERP